ncbi:hypothetical protein Rsub_06234 [Raphidocelis subcapitata]|uniref:Hexosyltransferase n=1 Tax=Raphidocelis subcapitata TaxID=307507 RepID=A0A2V0PA56_9CHLO|nr:hypothetical protein Rsub_06234 [Raphidocelis subcapitata]|eukprot:GBF93985.1 hypothetical protein Rsub_06234 [Raphidocelis subcapitata]
MEGAATGAGGRSSGGGGALLAVVLVSSARGNADRRRACRNTWFKYAASEDSPLPHTLRARLLLRFLVAADTSDAALASEAAAHGDVLSVEAPEGYGHLWRKVLVALAGVEARGLDYSYFVHADDDSLLRLDLLAPLLEASPRDRFYWGYIWNADGPAEGGGGRTTAPIRNPRNKSHMPAEQYPLDFYPPFASGCGFALSRDLVRALLARPLPDYRLLDPPFGIHLCGCERCVLREPVVPVHDGRVRPYRGIPIFHPSTLVQHYLRPEEMGPFYSQALQHARHQREGGGDAAAAAGPAEAGGPAAGRSGGGGGGGGGGDGGVDGGTDAGGEDPAAQLYSQLVAMGLLRR